MGFKKCKKKYNVKFLILYFFMEGACVYIDIDYTSSRSKWVRKVNTMPSTAKGVIRNRT